MPPGATPPLILNYNASTVPIIQLALSGEGLTEQNLADIGINQLRTPLVTVPGAAIPYPYGGKQRQVQIDLDPARCRRAACRARTSPTRSARRT
jgi:multidrug efflux pump subunit AcrB